MTPAQISSYIGLKWERQGRGPLAYDCWGLLRHCEFEYFCVSMPDAPIGDEAGCREMFEQKVQSGDWVQVDRPRHGDGALLRGGSDPHVGIFVNVEGPAILHSMEGYGVVCTPVRNLNQLGFGRVTYYRLNQ